MSEFVGTRVIRIPVFFLNVDGGGGGDGSCDCSFGVVVVPVIVIMVVMVCGVILFLGRWWW